MDSRAGNSIRLARVIVLLLTGMILPAFGTGVSHPGNVELASTAPTGTLFDHVVIIVLEDHGINQICGHNPPLCLSTNGDPYTAGRANQYAMGSQYLGISHFSQANYIALLGGDIYGCVGYPCQTSSHVNLVDRFEAAGLTWRGYMENQGPTSGCATSSNTLYTLEHNPFVFFTDITSNPARCANIFLANPTSCTITDCVLINDLNSATAPNFMWLTPNECDNMHGATGICSASIPMGDQYLSGLIPNILNSQTFTTTRSALFVTFDEGNGYCPLNKTSEDCVYAVWAGPLAKTGFVTSNLYNHYSFTKTIETNWNLASLATNDAAATPLTEFFNTTTTPPPTLQTSFTFMPSSPNTGQSVTFTASATGGKLPYTFSWNFGDGSSGTGSSTTHAYAAAGSYNVVLTAKDSSATQQTATSQQTVSVANPPPPLTASYTFSPSSPSVGQSVTFNATASGGKSPYTFNWNFGDGTTSSGNPVSHSFSRSGTFTVQLSVVDSSTATATATQTVTVSPAPLSTSFSFNPTSPSIGQPAAFTGSSSGGSPPYTYSWNFGDNTTSTGNPTSHSYSSAGTFTVQLTVKDSLGTTATATKSITVTVPPLSASFSHSPTSPTTGQSVNFTGIASGGVSPYTFNWLFGDGSTGTGNPVSHVYVTAGTFTVQLTVQDSIGSNASASQSITVTQFVPPDFTISPNPSTLQISLGGSGTAKITLASNGGFAGTINLSANISPSGPSVSLSPTSVTLTGGGSLTATLTVSTQLTTPLGNYTVTITGNSTSLSHSTTVQVTVRLAPDFSLATSSSSLSVARTTSGTVTLILTSLNGFNGTVNVSVTVSSSGPRASLGSSSVRLVPGGTGSDLLTIKALKKTPVGTYTVIVTATSGSITHTATVTVTVT